LSESRLIYYCYDNISAAQWLGKHGGALEKEFAELADIIITSSSELSKRFPTHQSKTYVVKNGVDFQAMQQGASPIRLGGRSVVGYIGSIDDRLDYDLLDSVISHAQDKVFRFIGRTTSREFDERLRQHSNVELLGSHPASDLPRYLKDMDVCIIPFLRNEFTRSIYPLKVNEYLAAGKPVIMTRFADLSEFHRLVYTTDTVSEFKTSLIEALESNTIERQTERQNFARNQSWTKRAEEISTLIMSTAHQQPTLRQ